MQDPLKHNFSFFIQFLLWTNIVLRLSHFNLNPDLLNRIGGFGNYYNGYRSVNFTRIVQRGMRLGRLQLKAHLGPLIRVMQRVLGIQRRPHVDKEDNITQWIT